MLTFSASLNPLPSCHQAFDATSLTHIFNLANRLPGYLVRCLAELHFSMVCPSALRAKPSDFNNIAALPNFPQAKAHAVVMLSQHAQECQCLLDFAALCRLLCSSVYTWKPRARTASAGRLHRAPLRCARRIRRKGANQISQWTIVGFPHMCAFFQELLKGFEACGRRRNCDGIHTYFFEIGPCSFVGKMLCTCVPLRVSHVPHEVLRHYKLKDHDVMLKTVLQVCTTGRGSTCRPGTTRLQLMACPLVLVTLSVRVVGAFGPLTGSVGLQPFQMRCGAPQIGRQVQGRAARRRPLGKLGI